MPQRVAYTTGERTVEIAYRVTRDGVEVAVDGAPLAVRLLDATAERVDLEVVGVRRAVAVHVAGGVAHVDSALGASALTEVPRFPDPSARRHAGSLLAPMPGGVLRVLAEPGAAVTAGRALVVLEAMKMEHTVTAQLLYEIGRPPTSGRTSRRTSTRSRSRSTGRTGWRSRTCGAAPRRRHSRWRSPTAAASATR